MRVLLRGKGVTLSTVMKRLLDELVYIISGTLLAASPILVWLALTAFAIWILGL